MSQSNVGWVSDSVTQQIQEHSPKYSGGAVMSGYATLTRPTMLNGLMLALGAGDQAQAQTDLLAEVLGLEERL